MKKHNLSLLVLSAGLILAGCGSPTPSSSETLPSSSDSSSASSSSASSSEEKPVEVADFDVSTAPKNFAEMREYLNTKSLSAEALYGNRSTREAIIDGKHTSTQGYSYSNGSHVLDSRVYTASDTTAEGVKHTVNWAGYSKKGDRYLAVKLEGGRASVEGYAIVEKEAAEVDNYLEISKDSAATKVGSLGVTEAVLSDYIVGSGFDYSKDSYTWTRALSEDKKSMSFAVSMSYVPSYGSSLPYIASLTLSINGNGLLTNAEYACTYYPKSAVSEGKIDDSVTPSYVDYDRMKVETGAKLDPSKNDIIDPSMYFASSFEAATYYYKSGNVFTDRIEAGYKVSVLLTDSFPSTAVDELRIIKSSDETVIAQNEVHDWYALKEGTATLTVTTLGGVEKEIAISVVPALPTALSAKIEAGDSLYVGETYPIQVTATPSAASADVAMSVDSASTGTASLAKDETTGLWSVTPKSVGNITLNIVSTKDPSVTTTLRLSAVEKPTIDSFKAAMTGKWKKNNFDFSSYDYYYLALEIKEDGTGLFYKVTKNSSEVFTNASVAFHYTIDEATFAVSFTLDSDYPSDFGTSYTALSFNYPSKELVVSGTYDYDYYGTPSTQKFTNESFNKVTE